MALLSGLPDTVGDEESISRFLTSRGHFNSSGVKPSGFLPNPKDGKLSVARHNADSLKESEQLAREDFKLEKVYGVGVLKAAAVREENLDFEADDAPPRHANIVGWPWSETDREFGKSERKLIAAALAQKAKRLLYLTT